MSQRFRMLEQIAFSLVVWVDLFRCGYLRSQPAPRDAWPHRLHRVRSKHFRMDLLRRNARVDQRALVRRHERHRPAHVKVSGADQCVIEPFGPAGIAPSGPSTSDKKSMKVRTFDVMYLRLV